MFVMVINLDKNGCFCFQNIVTEQISLDPLTCKTGDVWHVFLRGDFKEMLYGYIFDGEFSPEKGHYYDSSKIVLDPYGKVIEGLLFIFH